MDEQRRRTIIAEIEHWRRNQLLPEHYCIFLLNLYTEGEHSPSSAATDKSVRKSGKASAGSEYADRKGSRERKERIYVYREVSPVTGKMVLTWLLCALITAGLILLAFHFNRFHTPMQISIFTCFSLLFYILGVVFRRSNPPLTHLFLALFFFVAIWGGIFCILQLGGSFAVILLYLGVLCVLACGSAFVFGYTYLLYAGMIGLAILYGAATAERVADGYSWWRSELFWVPMACILTGVGFLMYRSNPKWSGVFAICGLLCFFGAEVQSLYIPEAKRDIIQLLLFIKVFLASAFFFLTRGHWYTWLRL